MTLTYFNALPSKYRPPLRPDDWPATRRAIRLAGLQAKGDERQVLMADNVLIPHLRNVAWAVIYADTGSAKDANTAMPDVFAEQPDVVKTWSFEPLLRTGPVGVQPGTLKAPRSGSTCSCASGGCFVGGRCSCSRRGGCGWACHPMGGTCKNSTARVFAYQNVLMRRLVHAIQDEEEQEPEVIAAEDRVRFEGALPDEDEEGENEDDASGNEDDPSDVEELGEDEA